MYPDPQKVEEIRPVQEDVGPRLISMPGVTGVLVGLKEVAGRKTPVHAIIVLVRHKGNYQPGDEIPEKIKGVPTDVIEASFDFGPPHLGTAAEVTTVPDTERYDPVQGGSCISPAHTSTGWGTLGTLVKDYGSETPLWLSCHHVLCADSGDDTEDKKILQPARAFDGTVKKDTIGEFVRGFDGKVPDKNLYVDAAVCTADGRTPSAEIIGLGTPKDWGRAELHQVVSKYGAATRLTKGVIVSISAFVGDEHKPYYKQYIAESDSPGSTFALPGDSGAAVLNSDGFVIGLLKGVMQGNEKEYTVVVPMWQITEALGIQI